MQVVKPATPVPTTTGEASGIESSTASKIAVEVALREDKRNATRAKRYLSGKMREMRSQGVKGSYQVVIGEPAQSIMDFSKEQNIDLVVMTTHGRSGLKRAILGSVADAVIRESGKPVLIVRPKTHSKN
jgi:hypothetical protein